MVYKSRSKRIKKYALSTCPPQVFTDFNFAPCRGAKYSNQHVIRCLNVVIVAWSFSDVNAICHVFSVLWMASCFHTMELMGQNRRRRVYFVQFARRRRHRERSLPSPMPSFDCAENENDHVVDYSASPIFPCADRPSHFAHSYLLNALSDDSANNVIRLHLLKRRQISFRCWHSIICTILIMSSFTGLANWRSAVVACMTVLLLSRCFGSN